jgi:MATE family multidrug resistance protein
MDSLVRKLLVLAWPIVLARATQAVIGFADALMVAPLGRDSLAAVTTGAINVFAVIVMPMGTVFILQSFTSQLRGRGDLAACGRYGTYGLILAAVAGVLALLVTPLLRPAVDALGHAPLVAAPMTDYLVIRLYGVGAMVGMEALGNWYGGLGNTRASMVAGVIAMVANVLLNYALIEPRFGLPGYGVAGAAWASTIATWLGFAALLIGFLAGVGTEPGMRRLGLRSSELLRVLRFGLPNGANWFMEFAAFALFLNVVVGYLGTSVLAAFNIVVQVNAVSFMPAFGLGSAGAILVGEAIGRRAHDEVNGIVKRTVSVAALWMGSVGVVYVLVPGLIFSLFDPGDGSVDELVAVGTTMLGLSALWQLFDAVGITLSESLRAAGDTTWCMAARIVLAWLLFVPMAWAAVRVFGGGAITVMVSMIVYIAALALAFSLRFRSGRWREIDLVGEPAP